METNDTGDPSLSSKNNIKDKTEECFAFYSVQLLLVYQMHLELGRIVERPVISWERDVLAIVQAQNYEPNYKIVRHPHTLFRSRTLDKIENDLVKIAIKFNVIFLQRKCLRSVWGCDLKIGKRFEAKQNYERALTIQPGHEKADAMLAQLMK